MTTEQRMVMIFDCETGESSTRPMTAQEEAAADAANAAAEAQRNAYAAEVAAELAAKESARTKLAALGLSEAEVAALVR